MFAGIDRGYTMFDRPSRRPSILTDVEQDCEYLLVEAAIGFARERGWRVCSCRGKEYQAVLTVDVLQRPEFTCRMPVDETGAS